MEPIPETTEAIEEYGPFTEGGSTLLDDLRNRARQVRAIVPDCVGLSLASIADGVTFTLVASPSEIAMLDALQYVGNGSWVDAAEAERVLEDPHEQMLDEVGWQLFAQGTAAAAVASTLSLPIIVAGRVVGSVNLYAASNRAFTGHHEELARVFDAWAPGAVTNADLSFTTRRTAEQAPHHLHANYRVEVASGILAAREVLDLPVARERLRDAAQSAGVPLAALAETLIELTRSPGHPGT